MKEETLEEMNDRRLQMLNLCSDIREAIYIIEKMDLGSRGEIIEILERRIVELKGTAESLFNFIMFKRKEKV